MPSIERACPDCGNRIAYDFADTIFADRLVWHTSVHCNYCGCAVEEDGYGPLPDDLRQIMLAVGGTWILYIDIPAHHRLLLLKTLRDILALSLPEVSKLRNLIPGALLSGTRAEMERIRIILQQRGIEVAVRLQ